MITPALIIFLLFFEAITGNDSLEKLVIPALPLVTNVQFDSDTARVTIQRRKFILATSFRPTSQPTSKPSVQPSLQPLKYPSSQPSRLPSAQPSLQPLKYPSSQPSLQPLKYPSSQPRRLPSFQPSLQPLKYPSSQPSRQPSVQPTMQPRKTPSRQPSKQPLRHPSSQPSFNPTAQPVRRPWRQPTSQPLRRPSKQPSLQPLRCPTNQPYRKPARNPSSQPLREPSRQPSKQPIRIPSQQPLKVPLRRPSMQPSRRPTSQPARCPLRHPTEQPSLHPTSQPTRQPRKKPSSQPTVQPRTRPSIYPTVEPSQQPSGYPSLRSSTQPSDIPSFQPTLYPSERPSMQPSRCPIRRPTCQPNFVPTFQPSALPTTPTGQPTGGPTGPSSQPSVKPSNPSRQPSIQPSYQPTVRPVVKYPSKQPYIKPTAQPKLKPSRQPNSKPSRQPSNQPFRVPTSQPIHFPSSSPSSQPQSTPTFQPSSMPTIYGKACRISTYYDPTSNKCKPCQPNSNSFTTGSTSCTCNAGYTQTGTMNSLQCRPCPAGYTSQVGATECIICRAGYFSKAPGSSTCSICVTGRISSVDGSANCTICPRGQYSPIAGATNCLLAPPGSFAKTPGSSEYQICDQGTYSSLHAQAECTSCASGTVTVNFGSISISECVSPGNNFSAGFICLFFAVIMGLVYVVFGRFHFLSFELQEYYVYPVTGKIIAIILKLKNAITILTEEVNRNRLPEELSSGERIFIWLLVVFLTVFGSAAGFLISVGQIVFFNLIIGWNGLNLGPLSEMFDTFENIVLQMGDAIYIPPVVIEALLYPLELEYILADALRVDNIYTSLPVPCLGAKAPIELFIFGLILTMAILFIQSNFNFIWAMTLHDMDEKLLMKNWIQKKTLFSIYLPALAFVCVVTNTNPFTIFLRFLLSFVNYGVFFANNNSTHELSQACVGIDGFQNQELFLFYSSTIVVWFLIPPMVYVVAGILCPRGGYTTIQRVRPLLLREWDEDDDSANSGSETYSVELNGDDYLGTTEPENNNEYRTASAVTEPDPNPPPDSAYLAIQGFCRSIRHTLSVELFFLYSINLWMDLCDRSDGVEESRQQGETEQEVAVAAEQPNDQSNASRWQKFVHYFSQYEIKARIEAERHSAAMANWDRLRQPPFHKLCYQVQQELEKELGSFCSMGLFSLLVSYFLAFSCVGHLFSASGRKQWGIVVWKYILFACVCVGLWTDEIFEAYEVTDLVTRFTNNHNGIVIRFLPLIVICRAMLLQALGHKATLISIVVVCTCPAPLFVLSPKLQAVIPPLWYSNSREVAMRREMKERQRRDPESLEETAGIESWIIGMRSISIFLSESRLVVFIAHAIPPVITLMILLKADVSYDVYAILLIGIIPYLIGFSLKPLLYIGKRLDLKDKDFLALGLRSCIRISGFMGSGVRGLCEILQSFLLEYLIHPLGEMATFLGSQISRRCQLLAVHSSQCMQWPKWQRNTIEEIDAVVTEPSQILLPAPSNAGTPEEDGQSSVNVSEEDADEQEQSFPVVAPRSLHEQATSEGFPFGTDANSDSLLSGSLQIFIEDESNWLNGDEGERKHLEEDDSLVTVPESNKGQGIHHPYSGEESVGEANTVNLADVASMDELESGPLDNNHNAEIDVLISHESTVGKSGAESHELIRSEVVESLELRRNESEMSFAVSEEDEP